MSVDPEWYELCNFVMRKMFNEAALLLERKADLRTAVNGIGETVFHYVAVENDLDGVAWLFSQGFNINTQDIFGVPAVFEVALLDYKELLHWFISNGADLKCRDNEGQNIKEYVLSFGHEEIAKHLESLGI